MNGTCDLWPVTGTSLPVSSTLFTRYVQTNPLIQKKIDLPQAALSWAAKPGSCAAASRSFWRHARFASSVLGITIPVRGQVHKGGCWAGGSVRRIGLTPVVASILSRSGISPDRSGCSGKIVEVSDRDIVQCLIQCAVGVIHRARRRRLPFGAIRNEVDRPLVPFAGLIHH